MLITQEKTYRGRKYAFLPRTLPDGEIDCSAGVIVVMATHNNGDRYFAYDALKKFDRCSLLFVTDPINSYYHSECEGCTYEDFFRFLLRDFDPASVTFFGSSMAGYGALYHAVVMNANAIISNPQINFDLTEKHCWPALRNTIYRMPRRLNLDEWLPSNYRDSAIYLIHGQNEMDLANVDCLLKIPLKNRIIGISSVPDAAHGFYINDFSKIFDLHEHLRWLRENAVFRPNPRAMERIGAQGALNV